MVGSSMVSQILHDTLPDVPYTPCKAHRAEYRFGTKIRRQFQIPLSGSTSFVNVLVRGPVGDSRMVRWLKSQEAQGIRHHRPQESRGELILRHSENFVFLAQHKSKELTVDHYTDYLTLLRDIHPSEFGAKAFANAVYKKIVELGYVD